MDIKKGNSGFLSKGVGERLNGLDEKQLDKLLDILDIGVNMSDNIPLDKEEKILVLSTENEELIVNALNALEGGGQ